MDLLVGNSDDDDVSSSSDTSHVNKQEQEEEELHVQPIARRPNRTYLNSAPPPSLMAGRRQGQQEEATDSSNSLALMSFVGNNHKKATTGGTVTLMNNPLKSTLYQPLQGPTTMDDSTMTFTKSKNKKGQNAYAGIIQANDHFDQVTFDEERQNFQRSGQALEPSSEGKIVTRTTLGYTTQRLQQFENQRNQRQSKKRQREEELEQEPKKNGASSLVETSDDEITYGIWGPPTVEERLDRDDHLTDIQKMGVQGLAPEQIAEREHLKERNRQRGKSDTNSDGDNDQDTAEDEEANFDRMVERKMSHLLPPRLASGEEGKACEPQTMFHGKEEYNYKGQSWISPPSGLGSLLLGTDDTAQEGKQHELPMDHHKCYVPKKCIHRFLGHNKGVHRIRLFPQTGHLLLSAGLDGKCKVWSTTENNLNVMRTYIGHTAAVRDVQFNHNGTKFVSCSFDRYIRLWNTESGAVLGTYTNRRVPYTIKFYPHDDNLFVVGCSDNKIVTYDSTTGDITQEYNHHLAPVNSILFVEDHGTKMITTSDDKKVLVWEWDIGVPIKYISDPTMHAMPCTALHPAKQYFCGQSLDNHIAVFQARDRFALQKKKKYQGHQVAGYACQMDISPDGQFLVSGDGNGKLYFWDWKRHKMLQKYRAHDNGPTVSCVWHPLESSTVFTCGWDGVIKMWK